ncbi:MAG: hypothetical protein AAF727_09815 [Pseudomonadota bacterium]
MRQLLMAVAAVLFGASTSLAQTALDRFDISIDAEDDNAQSTLMALATTFAMLAPQTSGVRKASRLDFRSGTDLIEDTAATDKLRSVLPTPLATSMEKRSGMNSPCDISRHRFEDTDVLVVVHDSSGRQPQDAHRCFVAGLWIYHSGTTERISVNDWRVPYARILGSLASGRPAFSGFVVEEN